MNTYIRMYAYTLGCFLLEKIENICSILLREYPLQNKMNTMDCRKNNISKKTNKGKGAGGANTNYYGKKFEEKINNQSRLLEQGYQTNSYTKQKQKKKVNNYCLSKIFEDKTVVFALQSGFKTYMKEKYNIEMFRCPDEAYIIEYTNGKKVIKIIEKKHQNVDGSVETKLWACPSLKREYQLVLGDDFEVDYCVCVSKFLEKKMNSAEKKYSILNRILGENNISVLFGDNENYFETLDKWLFNNSL